MAAPANLGDAEDAALRRALELAADSGIVRGPNPAVGCVIIDANGRTLGEGWHRGPGTDHAEVDALTAAGPAARGATAAVTLEPCAHHGRTPPCAEALIAAGVTRVVFAQPDPNPEAAGGAQVLTDAGIDVTGGVRADEAEALNPIWSQAMRLGRPVVTWKVAATLDGRVAAADGNSRWITAEPARQAGHDLRTRVDAVLTSTGTAIDDRPQLTARPGGRLSPVQPLRAVMGHRELPDDNPLADAERLRTHDPRAALDALWQLDVRHVMLEAGGQLAGAFLDADVVDNVLWFAAPKFLGDRGTPVLTGGPATLAEARGWRVTGTGMQGPDVQIDLVRER